ncbi:Cytochrome c oxidase subunit 6B [Malassezia japonica]|uniref:Cytochrome c oxidase subunit n=1 Tax=Malassezia japonica TaxID=223818 RepID=A0AAF0JB23_9BASI|nr:Cytochrome c oxidase subunit 6B [Malassezia japonica]WFD39795.1 Cytochrome c oxidase subunit 6B [Malassezia japonica]
MPESITLKTAEFDSRFPNQNQTRHCWQNYADYYRCINKKGEDYEPCKLFFNNYNSLCPNEWIAKWNELRENDAFPANLEG